MASTSLQKRDATEWEDSAGIMLSFVNMEMSLFIQKDSTISNSSISPEQPMMNGKRKLRNEGSKKLISSPVTFTHSLVTQPYFNGWFNPTEGIGKTKTIMRKVLTMRLLS